MKKFLYLVAAVFALTSLCGCGNKMSSETEKAKETVDSFFAALKDADFKTAANAKHGMARRFRKRIYGNISFENFIEIYFG